MDGKVIRRVYVTLDATTVTETILTRDEAVDVAQRSWRLPGEHRGGRASGMVSD